MGESPHPCCVDARAAIHPAAHACDHSREHRNEQPESQRTEHATAHRKQHEYDRKVLQVGIRERDHGLSLRSSGRRRRLTSWRHGNETREDAHNVALVLPVIGHAQREGGPERTDLDLIDEIAWYTKTTNGFELTVVIDQGGTSNEGFIRLARIGVELAGQLGAQFQNLDGGRVCHVYASIGCVRATVLCSTPHAK